MYDRAPKVAFSIRLSCPPKVGKRCEAPVPVRFQFFQAKRGVLPGLTGATGQIPDIGGDAQMVEQR